MNGDLTPYLTGEMRPNREERAVVAQAKTTYNKARKAAAEVDAVMGLGAHVMERAVTLDALRRGFAGDDPALNAILSRVEVTTLTQAERVQKNMTDGFTL